MLFEVSLDELPTFAQQFWNYIKKKKVFAFHGEMGAGKTTIIGALCHYKGVDDVTGSPTFSIINEYAYSEDGEPKKMFHIDLYRLKDEEEVMQAGVEDCVYSGSICMVEWAEKAPGLFDENTVHVYIEPLSATERKVEVKLPRE
ncbi:MAG TPA: tRNA (adenosine(37)-N6)-threonylcarbamoyltransferase complex ATPase subunit type 1 TsaE [Flavisolibacter sp.]|jgi:tRNA threonylcarbamoyladenosine biosynthesis protein TsaE|nr:tRNA (adenosine(37)-N6)-threonylcarbamoyltransferase complex ATPase subunit type 1 TsaE [Flavisolibacter sp.]